ncbi:MAG TPA: thiamine pyrophosphate-binding protein [Candidatus Omnitrophota bacterium]|nr:thiamine pyrophosphate-binding protein [Candidatus Omnitrophota bacterium]
MADPLVIGEYLIHRLYEYGVRHVFGVPGDYVLTFFDRLHRSKIRVINTCDEQGAGFAADAYARLRGLGAVCVTYCVGGLKLANTTAEAFAERSPVVVISGAPGTNEREKNPLLHHRVKDFDTQLKVYEQLTVASTVLNDPETAFREIDRVLGAAMKFKRPVYIELPRDRVTAEGLAGHSFVKPSEKSDPNVLNEALQEAVKMINAARQPAVIAGIELHRFGLQKLFLEFIEKANLPVVSTLLSKSVIAELHPLYMGVYEGAMGCEAVRKYVETSDCLVLLGAPMSDVDLGIFTARIDPALSVYVTSEKTSIRFHNFENVFLEDFIRGLISSGVTRRRPAEIPHPEMPPQFHAVAGRKMTVARLFQKLNSFLEDNTVVIADPGDAMFGGADLVIHGSAEFLAPAYYTSLGFSVPASLGAQLADPDIRPLVLVGDGAFQMTGMELGTIARFGLNPIVIILNNRGYGTERPMKDGPFNDIPFWKFSRLPEVLGAGLGFEIRTEDELENTLNVCRDAKEFCILDVLIDSQDISPALKRFTETLAKRVR